MSQDELRELFIHLSHGRRDAAEKLADLIYSIQDVQGAASEPKPEPKKTVKKAVPQ